MNILKIGSVIKDYEIDQDSEAEINRLVVLFGEEDNEIERVVFDLDSFDPIDKLDGGVI